jgi:hypothetical protein
MIRIDEDGYPFNNVQKNLLIKHMNNSDVLAYNKDYIASPIDSNFQILDAFKGTEKYYAQLEIAIKNNDCRMGEDCSFEEAQIIRLKKATKLFIDFMANVTAELETTQADNFDPNCNADYTVANCVTNNKPGFSKTDGYSVTLTLLEDGTQELIYNGPMFSHPLTINSSSLQTILDANTYLVAPTPNVPQEMNALLVEIGIFEPSMFNQETKELLNSATISETFVLKNSDGTPDYEIIDIGNGKGRNVLQYDLDKIDKKATPFIKAEVAGLLSSEQEAIAAWNVYLAQDNDSADSKISNNIDAWGNSWAYEANLPLTQNHKDLFLETYRSIFAKNYLNNYTINQLPFIEEDALVFDLAEIQQAKAQKYIDDNNLN